jgi:hypothetical protein
MRTSWRATWPGRAGGSRRPSGMPVAAAFAAMAVLVMGSVAG